MPSDKKKKPKFGYKKGVMLSVYYDIWIGGYKLPLSRKQCIEQISIVDSVSSSNSCTLSIADPNFVFINDNIYQENKKVKVVMGWHGSSYRIKFSGYICAIDISFGTDGIPTLSILCMDNTYRMNKQKKNKTFKNLTSGQIVQSIVKSYGFKCVIQSNYRFTVKESIAQSDQTDIEFICNLANNETYPFTATLVGDTFYYVKKGKLSDTVTHELTYRDYPNDIISFSPQINTETIQVEDGSTNTAKKKSNTSKGGTEKGDNDSDKDDKEKKDKEKKNKKYRYNPKTKEWEEI